MTYEKFQTLLEGPVHYVKTGPQSGKTVDTSEPEKIRALGANVAVPFLMKYVSTIKQFSSTYPNQNAHNLLVFFAEEAATPLVKLLKEVRGEERSHTCRRDRDNSGILTMVIDILGEIGAKVPIPDAVEPLLEIEGHCYNRSHDRGARDALEEMFDRMVSNTRDVLFRSNTQKPNSSKAVMDAIRMAEALAGKELDKKSSLRKEYTCAKEAEDLRTKERNAERKLGLTALRKGTPDPERQGIMRLERPLRRRDIGTTAVPTRGKAFARG